LESVLSVTISFVLEQAPALIRAIPSNAVRII
jgi:hypothetical protein